MRPGGLAIRSSGLRQYVDAPLGVEVEEEPRAAMATKEMHEATMKMHEADQTYCQPSARDRQHVWAQHAYCRLCEALEAPQPAPSPP